MAPLAVTESVTGVEPEVAERPIQKESAEAVNGIVPEPALAIETSCAAGVAPPAVYWKASDEGDAVRVGAAAEMVRLTLTVTGLFDAPAAEIVTVPVYDPTARLAGLTETFGVDGAVPEADERLSQEALAVAVQFSVPVPELVISMGCVAGVGEPCE